MVTSGYAVSRLSIGQLQLKGNHDTTCQISMLLLDYLYVVDRDGKHEESETRVFPVHRCVANFDIKLQNNHSEK